MGELLMFENHSCNMRPADSYIRTTIATMLLIYAVINSSILIGAISIVIYITAFKKFCFIYYFFKINERFSRKNYYLSFLPKYRSSPVFIFDKKGESVFKNGAGENELTNIHTVFDLEIKDFVNIIEQNKSQDGMLECKNKFYQIEFQGIQKEGLLLAYFNDVTKVMELNDEIEETQKEVIYAMGEIGETRSKETGNHVKRVAKYSKELALLYGLTHEEANLLQMASPMHDIGKVGIPDAILNAPRKLDKDEWIIMQTHAQLGYNMLKTSNKKILQAAATVANEHHEKWDGSGYPKGLSGENIHLYGRITAVADVFDALGSERVYKKAWVLDDILELFKNESGKHFEPKLIDLFLNNLDKFLKIRDKFIDVKEDNK
jgi:response regulator RpfG family c-di-GMP phosphodiesterase